MIAHCSRNAYGARRTLGLEPCRHIHNVAMDVSSVWNYISEVDAEAKADQPIGGLIAIVCGNLLCTFTAQRTAPSTLSNTMSRNRPRC